ncbi:MAG: type II secretion system F family protein [Acidimicrobiales bacterium]
MTATAHETAPARERLIEGAASYSAAAAIVHTDAEPIEFSYRAVAADGTMVDDHLSGYDEADVVRKLRARGLRPVRVRRPRRTILSGESSIPGFGPKVDPTELAATMRQFATMNRAGVSLLRTIEVLGAQSKNSLLVETLERIRSDVEAGMSLSDAAAMHPRVFDPLTTAVLRAGEASGALDEVLDQIAETLERNAMLRRRIRSALTYPAAVLLMVAGVVIAMLAFVIPTFAGIYADLGGTLPAPTRVLLEASATFTGRLPFIVIGTTVAAVGLRAWRRSDRGRHRSDGWLLRIPVLGPLLTKAALARIGNTMAVLSRAGVPVLEALRITSASVGNAVMAQAVTDARTGVENGRTLAESFGASPVIPPMVVQLVAVGEESGTIDQVMNTIGTTYADEVETSVTGLAALIEPLMMAFIGVVVGGMVVALYLPMFRVIDLVQ